MTSEHSENSNQSNQILTQDEPTITPLTCQERIDCSSPDIFQESLSGAWDLKKEYVPLSSSEKPSARFRTELNPEDVQLVNELGKLSADKLMEYVRNLQSTSLNLGEEEGAGHVYTIYMYGLFENFIGECFRRIYFCFYVKHGGKMVSFAGFSLPVQYAELSIRDSVKHTRRHASIFDVSHMMQTEIVGSDRERFLESLTPADILHLPVNNGTLSVFTNQNGGICDDLILSKTDRDSLYVVTNAGCIDKDLALLQDSAVLWRNKGKDVHVNVLENRALIAIQGPEAISLLRDDASVNLDELYFMQTTVGQLFDIDNCRITRCGYTGEDGFEVSVAEKDAEKLINYLLNSKKGLARLAGLGARDALRLEAGLCLYGNDINENTTPVEAAISFVVAKRRRQTADFPGAKKIVEQLENKSAPKKRVGFISEAGRSPRSHLPIVDPMNQASVGFITSGCPSPCLEKNVSMGYVDAIDAKIGRVLQVDFGGKVEKVTVSKMPFVPTKYCLAPKRK